MKNAKVVKRRNLKDLHLGEMIEEGMKEKGRISESKFAAFLNKKIKRISLKQR